MLLDDSVLAKRENLSVDVPVISIDGPSGSGKGSVASQLAKGLNWHFLDSGAIYRALAFLVHATSTPIEEQALVQCIERLKLRLQVSATDDKLIVLWEQRDITEEIRTEAMGLLASQLAVYPMVRKALLSYQRNFRQPPGLVADGRDMGTVVFPDAVLKIFLLATLEERVKRRCLQLKARGKHASLDSVYVELERRDNRDKQRAVAPLRAAKDAVVIDTTNLSVAEVLQCIHSKLQTIRKV